MTPRGLPPLPPPPAGHRAANSLIDELLHAQALAKSKRVIWLVGALLSAGSGGIGWIASKVDTLADLQAIRGELAAIRLDEDVERPGRLIRLERSQRYVWQALLSARVNALAHETPRLRALKEQVGDHFADVLKRRLENPTVTPIAAYDDVVANVAVP